MRLYSGSDSCYLDYYKKVEEEPTRLKKEMGSPVVPEALPRGVQADGDGPNTEGQ
jgi:hypothetical protein